MDYQKMLCDIVTCEKTTHKQKTNAGYLLGKFFKVKVTIPNAIQESESDKLTRQIKAFEEMLNDT